MKNATYEAKKAAVINEIIAAFDGVSREDGVTLHEATVVDDYGGPEERAKARAKDTEERWQDVPQEDIRASDAELNFLDPKGFHYYIPAYMVWYLKNRDNEDPDFWSNAFDSIEFALEARGTGKISKHDLSRFKLFSLEQSKANAHFLQFLVERTDWEMMKEEQSIRDEISKGETSEAEGQARLESRKRMLEIYDTPKQALERYWGRFL